MALEHINSSSYSQKNISRNNLLPLLLITSLFFLWGFIHNLDPILIAQLRKTFHLNIFQSSLIDSAVFIAYFIMAIPAGIIMKRYGYKKGIITGLIIFAIGAFLFVPAANIHKYILFLGALFVIACGLTILETAGNPYATILGPSESAAYRLNLVQSFNGLAASVAPLIGKWLILKDSNKINQDISLLSSDEKRIYIQSQIESVKFPFIVLGCILILIAIVFFYSKLPDFKDENENKKYDFFQTFKNRNLSRAVIAQFFYVGAQVCVQSFFILFALKAAGLTDIRASDYLAFYGFTFMLGRFVGTFILRYIKAEILLAVYSFINIILVSIAILFTGIVTIYALIAVAFFMSIMFPTIFAIGIKNLGKSTKAGSSLIIMSIVGGALLPPVLGYISDITGNIQYGYIVPLFCFVIIFLFSLKVRKG